MANELSTSHGEPCLTDLAMDEYLADELKGHDLFVFVDHLEGCARCRERLAELERVASAYHASPESRALAARLSARTRPRRERSRMVAMSSALALAAVALFALLPRSELTPEAGTRAKGESRLGFYVKHGTHVRPGQAGEQVAPGDQLRFTYSVTRSVHLTIVAFDAAKQASLYFSANVSAGQNLALPSAVELDGTLGVERIYGLFCAAAIDSQALLRELTVRTGALSPPAGCDVHELHVVKQAGH